MRVVHLIVGLDVGGAEMMLLKLLSGMDREKFEPTVVSLMDGGALRGEIEALGVPVHGLGMTRGIPSLGALWKLRQLAGKLAPDLVQGWMYHGNFLACLMAHWAPGQTDLLWNIRHSLYDMSHESGRTRALLRLSGPFSRQPRAIVFNSSVSIGQHGALGFKTERALMLPNGIDLEVFQPDPAAGPRLRRELGLAEGQPLVGIVGRRHRIKGHEDFLRAAAVIQKSRPDAQMLMIGKGLERPDAALAPLVRRLPDPGGIHWLGQRADVPHLMPALDVLVLASHSEGFPNVLGEAMACGTPCVTTKVGEAPVIVGKLGEVVPVAAPDELAAAVLRLLTLAPAQVRDLRTACRESIAVRYSLESVVSSYENLYCDGDAPAEEGSP